MKAIGLLLIILGVLANNVVYLQDLWLGRDHHIGRLAGLRRPAGQRRVIIIGMVLLARSRPA